MEGSCVHARGYCIDSANVSPLEVARLEHDAAAAHAYQQAIKEWWNEDEPDNAQIADAAVTWIEQRADEIMRGWGYDDAGQGAEG